MPTDLLRLDPSDAWEPWAPSAHEPWDLRRVGHLRRRAAFGGSWDELQADLSDGPEAAVERLMAGTEGADSFDRLMDSFGPGNGGSVNGRAGNDAGLQAWWLYRIIHSPHPLRERMTLFWHGHFATSLVKVQRADLMMKQNILMRQHALGKFGPFLLEMSRDPAMLVWLDSNSNTKEKPNENFARELMELFTLGVGHYSETDVREAARAFTGWQEQGSKAQFVERSHDYGVKTVLGQTGDWDGPDVVRIVLEQPSAPRFLARELYRLFISEADEPPPDDLVGPLADRLRASGFDIGDAVRAILRSRLFYSNTAFRQRVKGPVEYVAGLLHALEAGEDDSGSTPSMAQFGGFGNVQTPSDPLDGLGQTLFAPPSVEGWPGGEAWLNSATLIARHNLAWKVLQGSSGYAVRLAELLRRDAPDAKTPSAVVEFLLDLLIQPAPGEIDGRVLDRLSTFLDEGPPRGLARDRRLRELAHAIVTMPVYQLS